MLSTVRSCWVFNPSRFQMKILLELLPILIFFAVYQWQGFIPATAAIMIASTTLVIYHYYTTKTWNKVLLISTALLMVFGGMTIVFKNPLFIQYKFSVFYGFLAIFLLLSQLFFNKNWVTWMIRQALPITEATGAVLLWGTVFFFGLLASINIALIWLISFNQWVWVKTWGSLFALLLFALWQGWVIMKDPVVVSQTKEPPSSSH